MDIDIETKNRNEILEHFDYANISHHNTIHPTGVYFQSTPKNCINNTSLLSKNLFKIDLINNYVPYENVKDRNELKEIVKKIENNEIPWDAFEIQEIVEILFHIKNHYNLVKAIKPRSIDDLALILALIRPYGQKLLSSNKSIDEIKEEIWKESDTYHFKKSHAYAYAFTILVQLLTL